MTGNFLNSTLSNKLPIDSQCSSSKTVNHVSDHFFNYLSGPLICNS